MAAEYDTPFADLTNATMGKRAGGMLKAGLFLKNLWLTLLGLTWMWPARLITTAPPGVTTCLAVPARVYAPCWPSIEAKA